MGYTKNQFYLRRIHSLLGVIPIGAFLLVHLTVNHQATKGASAFNKASQNMESLPFLLALEILLIYLPILYHALYGVHIAFTAKENVGHYSWFRNWMFLLQRITGVLAFIFIAIHFYQTKIEMWMGHKTLGFSMMHDLLSNPWWLVFYIILTVAVIFHFANGLWSFGVTWGFLQSPKSQRVFTWVSLVVFIVVAYIGVSAILAFV